MSWIDQYKDAIEQAVRIAGVNTVAADGTTLSGKSDMPVLIVSCMLKSEKEGLAERFKGSLKSSLGQDQPFGVMVMSPVDIKAFAPVYRIGIDG